LLPKYWRRDGEVSRKGKTTATADNVLLLPSSPSLPYDLVLMIVARVPRVYYRTLSLVSKSFRSMVASPELYKVRSVLGLTERSCLYVCLRFGLSSSSCKWYTLSSKSIGGGYVLARVLMPNDDYPDVVGSIYSDLVAVGSDIYNIATHLRGGVSILDCISNTWRKAPSMPVELESLSAEVLDRKIYVLGRSYHHQDGSWKNWLHIYSTQIRKLGISLAVDWTWPVTLLSLTESSTG
ncbi:F-box/kelch-repeat protein At5g51250, partial [Brassica rapa]